MSTRDRLLADIAGLVDELAEPHPHVERVPYWDANRNRKTLEHRTVMPGLLQQLHDSVMPPSGQEDGPTRPHPASRPPLALEALSRHTAIVIGVTRWCWSLRLDIRDTPEDNLRALVGATSALDDDTAGALLAELRQWRRWCAVLTGWESAVWAPRVACPMDGCGRRSTLRLNWTARAAFCTACGAGWDAEDGSIYRLADAVRAQTEGHAA